MSPAWINLVGIGASSGVLATVTMDALSFAAKKSGLIRGAKGTWPGRWYLGMFRGQFAHDNIAASPPRSGELAAAVMGHYTIGITLSVFYWFCCERFGYPADNIFLAASYGIATCIFPWFLMYPAFGYGVFGRNAPPEIQPLLASIVNHLVYGLGLWWTAKTALLMLGESVPLP